LDEVLSEKEAFLLAIFIFVDLLLVYLLHARFPDYITSPRAHWNFVPDEEELLGDENFQHNIILDD
jgi:hypothetical protein